MAVVPVLAETVVRQLACIHVDEVVNEWVVLQNLVALVISLKVQLVNAVVFLDETGQVATVE